MYSYDKELRDAVQKQITEGAFGHLKDCRIGVLFCDKDKKRHGSTVYAETRCLTELESFLSGYDFVIIFYDKVQVISADALEVLIRHELMHVGWEQRGLEVKTYCVPHDVNDFRSIIAEHGVDWISMGR